MRGSKYWTRLLVNKLLYKPKLVCYTIHLLTSNAERTMYKLTLTTTTSKHPVIIYFGANGITVSPSDMFTYVYVNGNSWQTEESAESIEARIDAAIAARG